KTKGQRGVQADGRQGENVRPDGDEGPGREEQAVVPGRGGQGHRRLPEKPAASEWRCRRRPVCLTKLGLGRAVPTRRARDRPVRVPKGDGACYSESGGPTPAFPAWWHRL